MLNEEDPLVMYLIVRSSLNMSPGKIAAQVGHAVQFLLEDFELLLTAPGLSQEPLERLANWKKWDLGDSRKVVLVADDKEFERAGAEIPHSIVVVDNGHTQVPEGSETVVGLPPMRKSARPGFLKRMRVLP